MNLALSIKAERHAVAPVAGRLAILARLTVGHKTYWLQYFEAGRSRLSWIKSRDQLMAWTCGARRA